jgi:hypothetical protein
VRRIEPIYFSKTCVAALKLVHTIPQIERKYWLGNALKFVRCTIIIIATTRTASSTLGTHLYTSAVCMCVLEYYKTKGVLIKFSENFVCALCVKRVSMSSGGGR